VKRSTEVVSSLAVSGEVGAYPLLTAPPRTITEYQRLHPGRFHPRSEIVLSIFDKLRSSKTHPPQLVSQACGSSIGLIMFVHTTRRRILSPIGHGLHLIVSQVTNDLLVSVGTLGLHISSVRGWSLQLVTVMSFPFASDSKTPRHQGVTHDRHVTSWSP
jgi:hypothetical protein